MEITGLIEPNSTFSFIVDQESAFLRIDQFIDKKFTFYSRSYFQRLIQDGLITINNQVLEKPSRLTKENDHITVQFPDKRKVEEKAVLDHHIDVQVVHEHEHFLILYKPPFVLVHPPANFSKEATLIDWLLLKYQNIGEIGHSERPGIIHRLDKDTSGLIVVPRTNYAFKTFGDFFRERTIHKTYHALVKGNPEQEGTINFAIGRDPITKTRMKAFDDSINSRTSLYKSSKTRHAITHYKVLEYFNDYALVETKPVTGRTHQIRVHLAAIGHPIIGDTIYGEKSKFINRQALHAFGLSFSFDHIPYYFTTPLPNDFKKLLEFIRKNNKSA